MAEKKSGNAFSRLFRRRKAEERFNQNDWAQQWMNFGGNTYPLGQSMSRSAKSEVIANDFVGYVNGAYKSSGVVFACMLARQLVFTEMRFQYQKLKNGRPGDLFGSKELALLEHPWPNGDTGELLARALQDADLAGNHYVLKEYVGATSRKPASARLRRLRPDWVDIILTASPDEALQSDVAGYVYRPGGTNDTELWEIFPIDGSKGVVAHWSPIPDPDAQYRGMSPLTPVLTEIMADKAATKHKAKFFENAATPNIAVSFKETVTEDQFKAFMDQMNSEKHGVEHAYETLYLGGGADVQVIGANIQQMDFRTSLGHGETRIAAALRVHPTIVGLAEGMHGSTLNEGNFTAAKNQFADGTMRPLWRSLCNAYSVLVSEFDSARLWYDDRDISFLRQDRKDVAEIQAVQAQAIAAYIQSGYTADSARDAVLFNDLSLLVHTGLFSVQLLPPGTVAGGTGDGTGPNADKPGAKNTGDNKPAKGSKPAPSDKPSSA